MAQILRVAVALLLALVRYGWAVAADERVRGTVLETTTSYCEPTKRGGCSGTLTLQGDQDGKLEMLVIKVPLGIPISRGCDAVLLHRLTGKEVIITEGAETPARVARSIEVVDKDDDLAHFCVRP
jgi:hypothetical protein